MRKIVITYLAFAALDSFAQDVTGDVHGTVTFVTSQSVYVKFEDTEKINVGDTLKLVVANFLQPCLLVKNKSSVSVVCVPLNNCVIAKDSKVVFQSSDNANNVDDEILESGASKEKEIIKKERFHGRVSAASFSNISENKSPSHRAMYRLNFNAENINESKFSAETFLNFRQLFLSPEKSETQKTKFFNVYNLAITYRPDSTSYITVGRKINNKASSLGAIDGLQAEKYFGKFFTGAIIGFRPDFLNYGVNFNLFEYGAYGGLESKGDNLNTKTTLGALQQTNSGKVDRRYLYFQHSSTIYKRITMFTSSELDLYNVVNNESFVNYRLTNFYSSLNYRINRAIDFNVSYDSRKQIMYYETFGSDIERMLEDDQSRQGVRARVGVRPFKHINMGVSVGKRFQSSTQNQSENLNGYISHSKIPGIGGRLNLNYNRNRSNYMLSEIISVRLSQDFFDKKMNAEFYVRKVNYTYFNDINPAPGNEQYYYGVSLMQRLTSSVSFSVLGEMTTFHDSDTYRINLRLNKRFDTKKKKKSKKPIVQEEEIPWRL